MNTLRKRLATMLDPTPERIERELFELTVKAGRRCAHDFEHCSEDIGRVSPYMTSSEWNARAREWLRIFYPGGGPKDYRARLHYEIDRLTALLERNGIDPRDSDIPF
jgi:hypothetical protein